MKKILILLTASILSLFGATFNVSTTPELRTALSTAATNGEDDTIIIADGTYKTTDDGQGTFIYLSNEANKLTLQGSSAENVILSGDNQHQIFNHKSTVDAPMTLEKLSFVDGNNTIGSGGGASSDYDIQIDDCNFSNNKATYAGGGVYSYTRLNIKNSHFLNNSAFYGGGINSETSSMAIADSTFTNNSASEGGAVYSRAYSTITINNSSFNKNYADNGGGIHLYTHTILINNSTFMNNSSNSAYGRGAGIYAYPTGGNLEIFNSTFINNNNDGIFFIGANDSSKLILNNSLFANNNVAIFMNDGEKNKIKNTIFHKNKIDINSTVNAIIEELNNNYIDTLKLTVSNFASNNIFSGVTLGFIDEANGDYRLTESSGLINKGISTITGITLPTTDLDGNARIVGGGIDIGPYEFSTTKPTITAFTNSGTAKELSALTFNVAYSLSSGRTLGNISYDYTNDGSWTSLNTHSFNTAGSYTVNVKVTDSAGEYSVNSLQVTVVQLPFSEMTDEQKLIKAVNPIYYDAIIEIINKKSQVNTLTTNTISTLENSWSLIGSSTAITDLSIFSDASIIWTYVDGAWNAYSSNSATRQKIIDANIPLITNIPANSGIWVGK